MEQISPRPFTEFTEPYTALLDIYYPLSVEGERVKEHIKLEPETPWEDGESARKAAEDRAHQFMAEKQVLFIFYGYHERDAKFTKWYGTKPTTETL